MDKKRNIYKKNKKNNKKKIAIIISFLIILALFATAIFFIVAKYNKTNEEPSISSSQDTNNQDKSSTSSDKNSSSLSIPNINDGGFDANIAGVPVVMYHNIMEDAKKKNHPVLNNDLTVTTSELDAQLAALREKNYKSISIDTLIDYMTTGKEIPYKSVLLTFDDGYLSNTELAAPILRKYGFTATMFVITEGINGATQEYNSDILQYLTKDDMQENKDVFTYASHSNTLTGHNDYKNLSISQYKKELDDGLAMLKSPYIAYPLGHNTESIIKEVKDRGYQCAFTIQSGYAKKNGDLYRIPRFYASSPMSAKQFVNLIETGSKQ